MKFDILPRALGLPLLTLMSLPAASGQTCQVTGGCEVVDGTNDASCDGASGSSASFCDTVSCEDSSACEGATISDSETVLCTDTSSCASATIYNVGSLECGVWYTSCIGATISDVSNVACSISSACSGSTFSNVATLECSESSACRSATISNVDSLGCTNQDSCPYATISNGDDVQCSGRYSCQRATISNVNDLLCSGGGGACYGATISDIPEGSNILCGGPDEGYNTKHCWEANFESTNPYTLTCQNTPYGDNEQACGDGHVTNPGGSVFCYGGPSITSGACDNLSIDDSLGCLICGHDAACYKVSIVDGMGGKSILDVPDYPNNDVFVYENCQASDVVEYLNKVHPESGTVACQDSDDSDYCDVVEAYCENQSDDPNCVEEFQVVEGSWTKGTFCGVSPEGGNCAVNGNEVTCTGTGADPYTIDGCEEIECNSKNSCYANTFTNSDRVQCSANEACTDVTVSGVTNLVCSDGDSVCQGSTILDIPEAGYVDCGYPEKDDSYICRGATMTSENPFTLTCAGTPGESVLACAEGHITNPGGSVFCYGGESKSGICHELTISDSVGCVICGSDYACKDVDIIDTANSIVHSMRNNQIAVYGNCDASDVVDYLNKVHPDGDDNVSCQDDDSNGYCDVVETYCNRNRGDTNCLREFQQVEGSWVKEEIERRRGVDPGSLESGNDNGDKVSLESWIVGSVVIAFFVLVMTAVICCMGHKNHQWSWPGQVVWRGKELEQQEEGDISQHEETIPPTDTMLPDKDGKHEETIVNV